MEYLDPAVINAINSMKIDFWWMLAKLFVAALILLGIKNILSNIIGYFAFRSSKYVAIGSSVEVDGFKGVVYKITLTEVVIEGPSQLYIIPMVDAKSKRWILNKVS